MHTRVKRLKVEIKFVSITQFLNGFHLLLHLKLVWSKCYLSSCSVYLGG